MTYGLTQINSDFDELNREIRKTHINCKNMAGTPTFSSRWSGRSTAAKFSGHLLQSSPVLDMVAGQKPGGEHADVSPAYSFASGIRLEMASSQ